MTLQKKALALQSALAERNRERKRLRGPAGLNYAIADSIDMLHAEAWDRAVLNCGFFMARAYLQTLESLLPKNITPRYALIYGDSGEGRKPLAAVYMQIVDISLAQARPPQPALARKKWAEPINKLTAKASQRVLVCGNMLTYGQHGIAIVEGADEKLIWHGVAEVLYRVRQSEKLLGRTQFVMIKDLHDHHIKQAHTLTNLSYRFVETEPNMVLVMKPGWQSYDDYLASLSSKYRSNLKNAVFKPLEDAGCVVEQLHDLTPVQERIFSLYKSVQMNAGFRPFELSPAYFAGLQRAAADNFRCSIVRRSDTILGFLITVADGTTAIAYHIGFDREAAADLPLYLRLLHAGIADAMSLGCKQVSYGRTALEPKAALGAKPQSFGIMVRHCQPVLNKMIKHLLLGIEHDDAPERNPFKKAA
jgi:hypothetical protein